VLEQKVAYKTRQTALHTLLDANPDAIVGALDVAGCRVALPDSFALGSHRALGLAADRATMLDILVAPDRMAVVAAWERALNHGLSVVAVHALSDPAIRLTLTMLDAREDYGVWLALLARAEPPEDETSSELLAGPLVLPARPRQATIHKSMTAIITAIDANATKMFGFTAEQMLGKRSTEFIHSEDHDRAVSTWMQLISGMDSQRVRLRHRCADGRWLWVEVEHVHNGAESPDEVDVLGHISDISDEMAAHEALRRREQLFRRLAESLPTGVLQLRDDGSVVYANARLSSVLHSGRPASAADLFATVASSDRPAVEAAVEAAIRQGVDSELEVALCQPDGEARQRCSVTIAAVADEEGNPGALICVNDVTESARLREELQLRATHDPLTGCLNRSAVMLEIERLLSARDRHAVAVIFVDVDNFKPVNDRLGHAAGDELLINLARRLEKLCREGDIVGRLGGDEFVLVCSHLEHRAHTARIAARVRDALNHPVSLSTGRVDLRSSIGVASPEPGTDAEALVARADAAMYESKRRGKGTPVFFADIADAA
jgi:diguanylate cyclase (GGDEF)-like protein/PAS domain S-box-containing protein